MVFGSRGLVLVSEILQVPCTSTNVLSIEYKQERSTPFYSGYQAVESEVRRRIGRRVISCKAVTIMLASIQARDWPANVRCPRWTSYYKYLYMPSDTCTCAGARVVAAPTRVLYTSYLSVPPLFARSLTQGYRPKSPNPPSTSTIAQHSRKAARD